MPESMLDSECLEVRAYLSKPSVPPSQSKYIAASCRSIVLYFYYYSAEVLYVLGIMDVNLLKRHNLRSVRLVEDD